MAATSGPDFAEATKLLIRERAGYCCLRAECRKVLFFPPIAPDLPATFLGKVAHIRGARPTSARYDESMTDEERRSPENAILLCGVCHDIVDGRHSAPMFTTAALVEMRAVHEEWVRRGGGVELPDLISGIIEVISPEDATGVEAGDRPIEMRSTTRIRVFGGKRATGIDLRRRD